LGVLIDLYADETQYGERARVKFAQILRHSCAKEIQGLFNIIKILYGGRQTDPSQVGNIAKEMTSQQYIA
jgi:hypothetical protein